MGKSYSRNTFSSFRSYRTCKYKQLHTVKNTTLSEDFKFKNSLVFFQNEEIFVQLDELDELDRIAHA